MGTPILWFACSNLPSAIIQEQNRPSVLGRNEYNWFVLGNGFDISVPPDLHQPQVELAVDVVVLSTDSL